MTDYIISDLHLHHANIIKYCQRPFKDVGHMDFTIINNWNNTVNKDDRVFFLGDLSFTVSKDLKLLNGEIIFIKGNHDKSLSTKFHQNLIITLAGQDVLLIHNPEHVPRVWKGWVIHGHTHNNEMDKYPKVNRKLKTINVCVEHWNYTPIKLSKIIEIITNEDLY